MKNWLTSQTTQLAGMVFVLAVVGAIKAEQVGDGLQWAKDWPTIVSAGLAAVWGFWRASKPDFNSGLPILDKGNVEPVPAPQPPK